MGFFWPTRRNPDAGILVRLGRVAHWTGFLIGSAILLAFTVASTPIGGSDGAQAGIAIGIGFAFFAALAMGGRVVRYVLAAE
jgi:hypothetical protein